MIDFSTEKNNSWELRLIWIFAFLSSIFDSSVEAKSAPNRDHYFQIWRIKTWIWKDGDLELHQENQSFPPNHLKEDCRVLPETLQKALVVLKISSAFFICDNKTGPFSPFDLLSFQRLSIFCHRFVFYKVL